MMMKTLLSFLIMLIVTVSAIAQSPQKMSYQAVIRNSSNDLVTNQTVGMRVSILQGSPTGTVVYAETQTPTTNANGLINIAIGSGNVVSGTFSTIDWSVGPYFIKTEVDPAGGTAYSITTTSELLSVPYALYAKTVQTGDNWGTDVVKTDATLAGNGTTASPLQIARQTANTGQVLKWNGTTWLPANDNASLWQQSGSKIYYNNGYAGIGTNDPKSQLHLNSAGVFTGLLITNSASGITFDDGLIIGSQYQADDTLNRYVLIQNQENSPLCIGTNNRWPGDLILLPGGNVGIGTTSPTTRLDINGQVKIRGGNPGAGKVLTSDANGLASWMPVSLSLPFEGNVFADGTALSVLNTSTTGGAAAIGISGSTINTGGIGVIGYARATSGTTVGVLGKTESPSGYSGFFNGGKFYVSGNLGIGVLEPSTKLEVNGQVKIAGGNPGIGKVLTSDAYGLAVWATHEVFTLPYNRAVSSAFPLISITNSGIGNGLLAISQSVTGFTGGVIGEVYSTSGAGIIGTAWANAGTNYGVKGKTYSNEGFSGYFDGGKFFVSGNLGIGTTTPGYKVDAVGDRIRLADATGDWIAMRTDGGTNDYLDLSWSGGSLVIQGTTTDENIILNPSMNKVGIRNWTPQYDLDVNGNIRATGSIFYGGTAGAANGTAYNKPDYVFRDNYEKLNTAQVEEFLTNMKHLPWVTSAEQEKKENGDVTNMTRLAFETLESVENLQLQLIEQSKIIHFLKNENDLLKERLVNIEKQIGINSQ